MHIVFSVLLIIFAAIPLVWGIAPGLKKIEAVSLAYFLGLGLSTYLTFLIYWLLKIPINRTSFLVSLGLLWTVGMLSGRQKVWAELKALSEILLRLKKLTSGNHLKILAMFITFVPVIASLINNFYWPVRDWDALTLYDFRAIAIVGTHSLTPLIEQYSNYYFAYPLYTSMAHAYFYFFGSQNVMPFYALNFMFFCLIFYSRMRSQLNLELALFFTFFITYSSSIFYHSLLAYTNFPYTIFLIVAFLYLWNWIAEGKKSWLYLALLLFGCSLWTRDAEPFWITGILLIGIQCVRKREVRPLIMSCLSFATFIAPWYLFKKTVVQNIIISPSSVSIWESIKHLSLDYPLLILKYLYDYFIFPYFLLHLLFVCATVIFFKNYQKGHLPKHWPILFIIICNYAMVFAGTVLLSLTYSKWDKVGGSLERMALLFVPLIVFFVSQVVQFRKRK